MYQKLEDGEMLSLEFSTVDIFVPFVVKKNVLIGSEPQRNKKNKVFLKWNTEMHYTYFDMKTGRLIKTIQGVLPLVINCFTIN